MELYNKPQHILDMIYPHRNRYVGPRGVKGVHEEMTIKNEPETGEVRLAPCPACKKLISVDAAMCLGCGHPITPEPREAMIQGVLAQRQMAIQKDEAIRLDIERRREESDARAKVSREEREAKEKVRFEEHTKGLHATYTSSGCPECSRYWSPSYTPRRSGTGSSGWGGNG